MGPSPEDGSIYSTRRVIYLKQSTVSNIIMILIGAVIFTELYRSGI
jgi:hypothetical protein